LNHKAEAEENRYEKAENQSIESEEQESELISNIRLSIKTVEVMGLVIKNRAGSLDLKRLEYIFEQGLKVHLRIITSFLELIQNELTELEMVDFLTERINEIIENDNEKKAPSIDKIKKLAKEIYWNLNFGVLHGFLTKSIHSLGSNNLLNVAQSVSEKEKSPAIFIVNHGIKMWYAKNIRIDEIANRIKQKDFSLTAKKLMEFKIAEHCTLHKIEYSKLKEIENKLQLSSAKLLIDNRKNS